MRGPLARSKRSVIRDIERAAAGYQSAQRREDDSGDHEICGKAVVSAELRLGDFDVLICAHATRARVTIIGPTELPDVDDLAAEVYAELHTIVDDIERQARRIARERER